jgi:hypothetical protein
MQESSEDELSELLPSWESEGLTWEIFGTSTQSDIEDLKNFWFPQDVILKMRLHNIWVRHPIQMKGI